MDKLVHALRFLRIDARQHRGVIGIQCGPAQRNHKLVGVQHRCVHRLRVADDRAVAGAAVAVAHIGLTFDFDGVGAGFKIGPTGGRFVLFGVGRVDLLQIQILHIRPRIGKAPSHFGGAPKHN